MKSREEERMTFALEDVERFAHGLIEAAEVMQQLADGMAEVSDSDAAQQVSHGYATVYRKLGNELLRYTNRGLGK